MTSCRIIGGFVEVAYVIYLFKEKKTNEIIYVGSTSRPATRMKEHLHQMNGIKKPSKIHEYMIERGLKLYKDVEIIWCDCADSKESMLELETKYYFMYLETVKNDRPADNVNGAYNPRRRKVRCINTGEVFKTVSECAERFKKGRTTISNVLIKEKPYTMIDGEKFFFEYVNENV